MDTPIVTRVPQYIKDWLAERAAQEGRSLSREVQRILQQAHEQQEQAEAAALLEDTAP